MEREDKFLNIQYLETRLREIKEIRRKEVVFEITESDRAFSNSIYISFYIPNTEKLFKNHTLRISDHTLKKCPHSQFIIEPNAIMSKKRKAQFIRAVQSSIQKALRRNYYKQFEKVSKEISENN